MSGKKNPFRPGKAQPMLWEKIDRKSLPEFQEPYPDWVSVHIPGELYVFSAGGFYYLVKDQPRGETGFSRNIAVMDSKKGSMVFFDTYSEGESISLAPLAIRGQDSIKNTMQW